MTPAAPSPAARGGHPLEDSHRLASQATAAVDLLERFGDLLLVALEAVGSGDDVALNAALIEREQLLRDLEPLLASLAVARDAVSAGPLSGGPHMRNALVSILRPVDEALRHAQLLHVRLTDEVGGRAPVEAPPRPPIAIVR